MAVAGLLGLAVPVILAIWLTKKCNVRWIPIAVGAGVFFVFVLVLEAIMHLIVLKGPSGQAIMGNMWYYALYGGLAAGIFEETGRLVSMKWLLRRQPDGAETGVGYGIGHGGFEMMIIFGVTMISNLVLSLMINSGKIDSIMATVPPEAMAQVQEQFSQLSTVTAGTLAIGLWERLSALVLQVALSLFVWAAVRRGGKWLWLFPAAILLHALVDGIAVVLSQSGVNMAAIEVIISALAVAIGAMAWMIWKKQN